MNSAPLWGMATLLFAALTLAACAPKSEPETASAETEREPTTFIRTPWIDIHLNTIESESNYIRGVSYHGGGWWDYEMFHTAPDEWFWLRDWKCEVRTFASEEDFSEWAGEVQVTAVALLDLMHLYMGSGRFDSEATALSVHGGQEALTYEVEFSNTTEGLQRIVTGMDGIVEYATYDESILDAPVSRDIRQKEPHRVNFSDELILEVNFPPDRSQRIGDMIFWEPRGWIPMPAIAVLPFDEIQTVSNHEKVDTGHSLEIKGTGLGRKLLATVTIREVGHTVEIVDAETGKVLISAREVYEKEKDRLRHD